MVSFQRTSITLPTMVFQEVKKMENKKVVILALAILAALVLAVSATYAMMGRQGMGASDPYGSVTNGYRMGPSMMGGSNGYAGGMMGGYSGSPGGMMGGHGMMGNFNGMDSTYQHMKEMRQRMNSTATP